MQEVNSQCKNELCGGNMLPCVYMHFSIMDFGKFAANSQKVLRIKAQLSDLEMCYYTWFPKMRNT